MVVLLVLAFQNALNFAHMDILSLIKVLVVNATVYQRYVFKVVHMVMRKIYTDVLRASVRKYTIYALKLDVIFTVLMDIKRMPMDVLCVNVNLIIAQVDQYLVFFYANMVIN